MLRMHANMQPSRAYLVLVSQAQMRRARVLRLIVLKHQLRREWLKDGLANWHDTVSVRCEVAHVEQLHNVHWRLAGTVPAQLAPAP
jgi:hypothetical protein